MTDDEPVALRTFLSALAEAMDAPAPMSVPKPVFRLLAGPVFAPPLFASFPASNDRIRERLGFEPQHPTYREGAAATASAYAGDPPRPAAASGRPASEPTRSGHPN